MDRKVDGGLGFEAKAIASSPLFRLVWRTARRSRWLGQVRCKIILLGGTRLHDSTSAFAFSFTTFSLWLEIYFSILVMALACSITAVACAPHHGSKRAQRVHSARAHCPDRGTTPAYLSRCVFRAGLPIVA